MLYFSQIKLLFLFYVYYNILKIASLLISKLFSICVYFNAKHVSKHAWFYALQILISIKTAHPPAPVIILLVETAASHLPHPHVHAATRYHVVPPVTAIYLPPISHTKVPFVKPVIIKNKNPTTCVPASEMWWLRSLYQLLAARIPLTLSSKPMQPSSVTWFKTTSNSTGRNTLHVIYVIAKNKSSFQLK